MRIEDAGLGFHYAHRAIEGLDGEKVTLTVRKNGSDVQTKVLRMHFGSEAVANALLLASRNLDAITGGSQVADHLAILLKIPEATAKEIHSDRVRLVVSKGDQRLGWVTVDELHTKDLGGRERRLGLDSQIGDFSLRDLLSILLEMENRRSVN